MKAEIEKLKQLSETGNTTMDHTNQNPQKIQTERKVQESSKNGPVASEIGDQIEKIEILSVTLFVEDTMQERI